MERKKTLYFTTESYKVWLTHTIHNKTPLQKATQQKEKGCYGIALKRMVDCAGLEPTTTGLKVRYSTN